DRVLSARRRSAPGDWLGTIIAFGGTMSGFLCASGSSVEPVETDEPLRERSTLYLDNKHYIELIRTRSGHQSIISALSRLEGNKSVIGLGFFGGIAPAVNVGDLLVPIKAEPLQTVPLTVG